VQHPERERLLQDATVGILAPDAGVGVTLRFAPGSVTVTNGMPEGKAEILVRANSDTLIELSSVPLRFGLPDAGTKDGRAVTRKLIKGEIKVKGMYTHPGVLARLNKLLSVN
jgi:hypothetical protein